jgi:hypothetical protein
MAKGGGGKGGGGGGGASSGASSGAASSGGGGSKGGGGGASSSASAAASTPAQTKQEAKVAAQQAKQEAKVAAQEVKTAQRTTNQVAQEVKKTGAIANLEAYNQALAVLKASKPTAATKAEANVQKIQTKNAAKNVKPINLGSQSGSSSTATTGTQGTSGKPDEIAGLKSYFEDLLKNRDEELGTKFDDIGLKLEGQGDAFKEAMGEFGTNFKDQLSGYQNLLLQLKTPAGPAPYSAPASDQSDDFKAFDPNLFTDLLAQVQGGSSMEQRRQLQEFKQQDESRDYAQALKSYRF